MFHATFMGYSCRSLPAKSIFGVCRISKNPFWCVWILELMPVQCDGLCSWLNYFWLILIEMECQIRCSLTAMLNFFCADVNVKVRVWCKNLLFNFSLSWALSDGSRLGAGNVVSVDWRCCWCTGSWSCVSVCCCQCHY